MLTVVCNSYADFVCYKEKLNLQGTSICSHVHVWSIPLSSQDFDSVEDFKTKPTKQQYLVASNNTQGYTDYLFYLLRIPWGNIKEYNEM